MSQGFNDNGAVYGSQKVTFTAPTGGTGGTGPFVAKNIKMDAYDAGIGTSSDEMGNETKQWFMGKIPGGTMTLQCPDPATKAPDQYATTAIVPIGGGTGVPIIIYKLGETYESGGETLMDVSFRKKMAT